MADRKEKHMAIEKDTTVKLVVGGMAIVGGICFIAGCRTGANSVARRIATVAATAADTAKAYNRPMLFKLTTTGGDVYGKILPYATEEFAKTAMIKVL